LWDMDTRQIVRRLVARGNAINGLALSGDSKRLLVAVSPGQLELFSLPDGKMLPPVLGRPDHTAYYATAVMTADGSRALSVEEPGRLRLWDVNQRKELLQRPDNAGPALCVALSRAGHALVGQLNGVMTLYDASGAVLFRLHEKDEPGIRS